MSQTLQSLSYAYDRQIPRFLEQLVRAYSGFQYMTGYNGSGPPQLMTVPCTLANTNFQVASIIRNNSENTLLSAPRITIWQTGLSFTPARLQNPNFVDTRQAVEREFDSNTNTYTGNKGNSYTIKRLMPIPFEMAVEVSLWTSNQDQKFQLMEQILLVTFPYFDIQNGENALDWTALTTAYGDDITWSSKSLPIGTTDEIDVATIRLKIPIWISPPAKVTTQNVIQRVVTNVYDGNTADLTGYEGATGTLLDQGVTTYGDYAIQVAGANITLLGSKNGNATNNDADYNWQDLLYRYGMFKPAVSSIWLYYTDNYETGPFVSGTIQLNDSDPTQLIWQIDPDTLPANTLAPISGVIDPLKTYVGKGLPTPVQNARYLIASDIGPSQIWGDISARENDIIQYVNGAWTVSFSSNTTPTMQLVLNQFSGTQLKWTGSDWVKSIDAIYPSKSWRLKL
jgi:hypothetical protein